MTSTIDVYCRVRPTDKLCAPVFQFLPDQRTIRICRMSPKAAKYTSPPSAATEPQVVHTYTFDGVLNGSSATQENIFTTTASKLVRKGLLQGINGALLCYGQRESGKTYTVFGGSDFRARGIAARAVHDLFEGVRSLSSERAYDISLTFISFYGERVQDLLQPCSAARSATPGLDKAGAYPKSNITLDGKGQVVLKGIEKRPCATEQDALSVIFEGLHNRNTNQNAHLALSIYARHQSLIDSESETKEAVLHLVDLAGTQRVEGLTSAEERREVQLVNRSLSMLEQVVLCLSSAQSNSNGEPVLTHVPYRQSKLTTLLKDCIGGTSYTSLIAHIFPEQPFVESSISTLNFAKRLMHIVTEPTVNVVQDASTQIRTLQRQVADLKSELRMQNQLSLARLAQASLAAPNAGEPGGSGAGAAKAPTFDMEELQSLREKVKVYVEGGTSTINVNDVREMNACFSCFRSLIEERDGTIADLQNEVNALKAQNTYLHSRGGNRSDMESVNANGLAGLDALGATGVSALGASMGSISGSKSRRRPNNAAPRPAALPNDNYTSNVLDQNCGVSFGVAGKASNALPVPEREAADLPPPKPAAPLSGNVYGSRAPTVPPLRSAPMGGGAAAGGGPHGIHVLPSPPSSSPLPRHDIGLPEVASPPVTSARLPPTAVRPAAEGTHSSQLRQALVAGGESDERYKDLVSPVQRTARSRAFEDYKTTDSGALQVRALNEERTQLQRLDKKLSALRKRLEEVEEEEQKRSKAEQVSPTRRSVASKGVDSIQLMAFHNTLEESLIAVNAERSHLAKQLERRRRAFLSNFLQWYARLSGDATKKGTRSADQSGLPSTPPHGRDDSPTSRLQSQILMGEDDQFMDAAERFDSMVMDRHTSQEPDSLAFYAAKKLVDSKTRVDRSGL